VTVAVEGKKATSWLHVDDVERFRGIRATAVKGVRLVPPSDPFLQQRDRELLVPDAALRKVVWPVLGGPGLLVIEGTAGGTWRAQKKGKKLSLVARPFEPLRPKDRRALDTEAGILAQARGTELAGVTVDG
jgi:hypothetical protein